MEVSTARKKALKLNSSTGVPVQMSFKNKPLYCVTCDHFSLTKSGCVSGYARFQPTKDGDP